MSSSTVSINIYCKVISALEVVIQVHGAFSFLEALQDGIDLVECLVDVSPIFGAGDHDLATHED